MASPDAGRSPAPGRDSPLRLSVIVPSFRRTDGLRRCLEGLAAQSRAPEEVVVVYRPAEDPETGALVRGLVRSGGPSGLRGVPVDRPGLQAALEAGVAAAVCEVVAATDDDAVPRQDWAARLLAAYGPGIGGAGGRDVIHTPDGVSGGTARTVGRVTWLGRLIGNHHIGAGPARDVDVLKGVNISLRRELWRFEHELAGRGAQVHWELHVCLRARRLGWRLVYDPAVLVDHYPAPRPAGDDRTDAKPADAEAAAYNETLALLAYAPATQAVFRALYRATVSDRDAPGWLRAALAPLLGQPEQASCTVAMRALRRAAALRWPRGGARAGAADELLKWAK